MSIRELIFQVIIHMQVPIVIGLVFLSNRAFKILEAKGFKYISIAWALNLLYLLLSIFETQINKYYEDIDFLFLGNNWTIVKSAAIFLDTISGVFFIIGSTKLIYPFHKIKRSITIQISILLALITFSLTIIDSPNNGYTFLLLFDVLALGLFTRYAYVKIKIGKINYIFIGALFYTITQLVSVFGYNYAIGFLLGFLSKSIILYGFHIVFLKKAEEKINLKQVNEILDQLLGSTFHELAKPINQMEENLDDLTNQDKDSDKMIFNSKARAKVDSMNNAFQRMKAIFIASLNLYEEKTDQNLDKQIYIKKNSSYRTISLNNLIEQAFLSARANRDKKNIQYYNEYSGNADIKCEKFEIIEAITNIINNAIEAVGEEGKILIKSKGIVLESENYIQLSIIDDGPGILKENLNKVLEIGFTTKKGDGHGFGLFIANKLIIKNKGRLEIESPYISKINKNENNGTAIKMIFKKNITKIRNEENS